jgi:hypothetical protein
MKINYSHVFLDFDATLFDTWHFTEWIDDYLVQKHEIVAGAFKDSADDFHTPIDEKHRLYRHAEHVKSVTKRNWSFISAEIEKAWHDRHQDFCYPEVHKTLRELHKLPLDIRILTYGDAEFQRFKLNSCQVLHELRIPIHVVDEPKRLFLEREFAKERGILVDDKHPLQLPTNWLHLWLDRRGYPETTLAANEKRIISFDQLLAEF